MKIFRSSKKIPNKDSVKFNYKMEPISSAVQILFKSRKEEVGFKWVRVEMDICVAI